ncbi:hypothetical protein EDB86DRAFT_1968250 [Lactarius hatsudake]|nr:hypothetical protein EDB86DRAFT_1968250 [Lactarius hatsudake]
MAAPPHPPVMLLAPPNDDNVPIPPQPTYPPTVSDVNGAIRYRQDVDTSIMHRHPDLGCDLNDRYNAVIYEHTVIAQAAAATGPQAVAPPWVHQLRLDIRNDIRQILTHLRRLMNQGRGTGNVVPLEIVPFVNGDDPTLPPHNLPPLHSEEDIEALNEQELNIYLTRYGVHPLPGGADPLAARRQALKGSVGASF